MMSPWMNGSQGQFFAVPGLAEAAMQAKRDALAANQQMADFAGKIGKGIYGGMQGAGDPSAYGADVSATQAGFMGFADAFNDQGTGWITGQYGEGGGGGMLGLMGRAAGGGGGGGGGGGVNFKQFASMGKMADGAFDASLHEAASSTPQDQEAKGLGGFTKEQWQHLGTADKVNTLKKWQEGMQVKTATQAYDMGQQHLLQAQRQNAEIGRAHV